jgi:hypothetical protein
MQAADRTIDLQHRFVEESQKLGDCFPECRTESQERIGNLRLLLEKMQEELA